MKTIQIKSITIILLFLAGVTSLSAQTTYWVTKSGDDINNSCTNATDDVCLTIQKGISMATQPGDIVNIGAGTYIEDTGASLYTTIARWFEDRASLGMTANGEPGNPITIQATPGSEGQVIIDSQGDRIGFHMRNKDYITIRGLSFINNKIIGIANWGQNNNEVADESRLSIGVIIENNYIYNTVGALGKNVSAVGMWGSKDWVVRNNKLEKIETPDPSTNAAGIQAYGTINALIENNDISDTKKGVFWKTHFVANAARDPVFESEIRFNKFSNISGVGISIPTTGLFMPAGENYIHHNIFMGVTAIYVSAIDAVDASAPLRFEHNIVDGGLNNISAILSSSISQLRLGGNITTRINHTDIVMFKSAWTGEVTELVESDYNIFSASPEFIMDQGQDRVTYTGLANWQAALANDSESLGIDNPDTNSISQPYSNLFAEPNDGNYNYLLSSPAIGFMPDGSNAGPYQFGNEIIGLLPQWPGVAPSDLIFSNGFE